MERKHRLASNAVEYYIMSWFKELTNKAEAILVKLDQDAAQALQKDGLLEGVQSALNNLQRSDSSDMDCDKLLENDEDRSTNQPSSVVITDNQSCNDKIPDKVNNHTNAPDTGIVNPVDGSGNVESNSRQYQDLIEDRIHDRVDDVSIAPVIASQDSDQKPIPSSDMDISRNDLSANYSPRKFAIQTSRRDRDRLINSTTQKYKQQDSSNGSKSKNIYDYKIDASDIRASINQSLREYADQALQHVTWDNTNDHQPSTSHYDDQPIIVTNASSHSNRSSQDGGYISNQTIHSASSFNIDFPDETTHDVRSSNSSDIAVRLLKHGGFKRKSTFYLHKVINRLASPNSASESLMTDQMKIKLRRAKLRAASYARRLNYYFKTYPMMKYVMLAYLVFIQIIIVYVLFFYQSNSSSSDLSSQVRQQQALVMSQSDDGNHLNRLNR